MLSEKEKRDILEMARSESLREDMRRVKTAGRNPFMHKGEVDLDAYLEFLNAYNEFIGHRPKPFKPMVEKDMKL